MEIKMAALIFSLSFSLKSRNNAKTLASHLSMWVATSWVDGCHRELHAPHRGAVPLGQLFSTPRVQRIRSCSAPGGVRP